MIRVCYVLSTSEKSSGANKSLIDLLKHLNRELFEPYVLLRRHGNIEEELVALDIPRAIIPYINSVTTGNATKDFIKKISYRMTLPWIKWYYRKNRIDIIHNNSMPVLAGMEAAYELGIPYICHIRENVESGLGVSYLNKKRHLMITNAATRKIAISQFINESYSKNIDDMEVIYDGIEVDEYYEEKSVLNSETIKISIYGNLDKQKGQIVAVKALELLQKRGIRDVFLNIVGNQNTKYGNMVKKYVSKHKVLNIEFVDNISDAKELKIHRTHDDINLICSSAEGLGRVTIESMLAGCLTIGANSGATKELINSNTGLFFDVGNYRQLADIIEKAVKKKNVANSLAKAGQIFAKEKFDINRYSEIVECIYKEILGGEHGYSNRSDL